MTTIFITGASSGIGAALAEHYSTFGATLGLLGRNAEALAAVQASCLAKMPTGQSAPKVRFKVADVTDAADMARAMAALVDALGVPDIVVANAGVSRGTLAGAPEDMAAFREVFDTNVLGLVHTFTPLIPAMRARRSGTLVGIASIAGLRGIPGSAAYSASKAAAISYCEALRVELRGAGVHVLTLCPGYIDTPMTRGNGFKMPFLLNAEVGAARLARAIAQKNAFAIIPWQMSIIGRVMRRLPTPLYDAIFARMPRKPRVRR